LLVLREMLPAYCRELVTGFCDLLKDITIFPVDVVGSELTLGLFSGDIVHVSGFF
jgi:hypothetical protein